MAAERTEAVVLRSVDFSQTSRIVTFLTPDRGRLACMAKGVRRPKSVLAAQLDTFNHLEIVYYWKESRSVQLLTECSALDTFPLLKGDLAKSTYMSFPLEIAYKVAHENEPSESLFDALVAALSRAEQWKERMPDFCAWSILRLLSAAGFEPSLSRCCFCGDETSGVVGFSYQGGVTCPNCSGDLKLTEHELEALKGFAESRSACPAITNTGRVFDVLRNYASTQLETDFRSVRVIDQMYGKGDVSSAYG